MTNMENLKLPGFSDAPPEESDASLDERIAAIEAEIRDEYLKPHSYPWIVGYSGGKDSTLVAHLVFNVLLNLPRSERTRPVHIIANDTLVESPLIIRHLTASLAQIKDAGLALRLPVVTHITQPELGQTFWVNLIGRGYSAPNRSFRWCTDRMKIRPTSAYIRAKVTESENAILLLGVRRSESAMRAASVRRYDNGERLNKHNDLAGCLVFRPIVELSTDDVWEFLGENEPPWGGSHRKLIKLYRDAGGGECPVVTQKSDAPSCGTTSSRFGCWTCTVVKKDRSLEGFVESGFSEFGALIEFRDWLASIRNDPKRRQTRRRNGYITFTSEGEHVPGPFTLQVRHEILDKLLQLQENVGLALISSEEVEEIRRLWSEDLTKPSAGRAKLRTIQKVKR